MSTLFKEAISRSSRIRTKIKSRIESGAVKASDPAFDTTLGELAGAKKKRITKKRPVGRTGSILTKRRQPLGEVGPKVRRPRILSGETLG